MIRKNRFRLASGVLTALSIFSMVATPAYSAPSGKRVSFQTSAVVLEYVKRDNPGLYQRLIRYHSGQKVHVTKAEHAYLKRVNRVAAAAAKGRASSQYEFSSQSRLSPDARAAYGQAATQVVVTPDPWKRLQEIFDATLKAGGLLTPLFPVIAPVMVVITIILIVVKAIGEISATWAKTRT